MTRAVIVSLFVCACACACSSSGSSGFLSDGGDAMVVDVQTSEANLGGAPANDASGAGGSACTPEPWSIAVLDSDGVVGRHPSLAVDANGDLHLSYSDTSTSSLWYLHRPAAGTWAPAELVDDDGLVGDYDSLAVDAAGGVHISYQEASLTFPNEESALRYVTKPKNGVWSTPLRVHVGEDVGVYTSIAIGANGSVHIAYLDRDQNRLEHVRKPPGGGWEAPVLGPVGTSSHYVSMVVDASDGIHVAYQDLGNGLRYVHQAPGGSFEPYPYLDSPVVGDGSGASLIFDAEGTLHVTHTNHGFLYDWRKPEGQDWQEPEIVSTVNGFGYTDLALDPVTGAIHLCYTDGSSLMHRSRQKGEAWSEPSLVDDVGGIQAECSISVDGESRVHIAYYDSTNADLVYASRATCTASAAR